MTHLSWLVAKALEGEEVILAKSGKPLVRLTPVSELTPPAKPGLLKGEITIAGNANESSHDIEELSEPFLPCRT